MMNTFTALKAANAWRYSGDDQTPVRRPDTLTRGSIPCIEEPEIEEPTTVLKSSEINVLVSKDSDIEGEAMEDASHSTPSGSPTAGGEVQDIFYDDDGIDDDDERYIQLDPNFAQELYWSNHPGDLAIQTYFRPTQPNLETDYNIPGLRPVLREPDGFHRFLLKDPQDRFYIWDEDDHLWWVMEEGVDEQGTLEEKVDYVMCRYGALHVEPVYQDYHPADDTVKVEMFRKNGSRY